MDQDGAGVHVKEALVGDAIPHKALKIVVRKPVDGATGGCSLFAVFNDACELVMGDEVVKFRFVRPENEEVMIVNRDGRELIIVH